MRRLALFFGLCLLLEDLLPLRAVPLVSTCAIQGRYYTSPYNGQTVRTRGVVFADLDETAQKGFYIQDSACDSSPSTSDGLFIYLGERINAVQPGDQVEVSGLVNEYYGLTELQAAASAVAILARSQPLPAATPLSPPFEASAARAYFEARESMYVRLDDARVVGPTDSDDRTWVVETVLGLERVPYNHPAGLGGILCVDDRGLYEIYPEAAVGQQVLGLLGALDFRLGQYCLELTATPNLLAAAPESASTTARHSDSASTLGIASFNLANLFDTLDDPAVDDDVLSGPEYQRRLQKRALALRDSLGLPDVVALQEAENRAVLEALITRPEIQVPYQIVHFDGPDVRGLDIALLLRSDRVALLDAQVRQGCTSLIDGLGPDGNGDVLNPQNALTCDQDGDGQPDGNRLFSRPPLAALIQTDLGAGSLRLWVLANHWKSRLEDSDEVAYTLPRRQEQAAFTAAWASELQAASPSTGLVILGDLNDYPGSGPLATLAPLGLTNLLAALPSTAGYTYIYHGVSQPLDTILLGLPPGLALDAFQPLHINADFPYSWTSQIDTPRGCSDHDPLLAVLAPAPVPVFLPLVRR